jgi:4'-phosphopantetheinyl transferase EntD
MEKEESMVRHLVDDDVLLTWSPLTAGVDDLLPAERAAVAAAHPRRQREFATGRVCARALLSRLGATTVPLLSRRSRAPVWPAGFVGSISHTRGLCVVAVARRATVAGVGVDVEEDASLAPDVWDWVGTDAENVWLRQQPPERRWRLARAIFSAKECTYKCLSPWLRAAFEPRRIAVEFDLVGGRFRARVAGGEVASEVTRGPLAGSLAWRAGWVLTAMTLRSTAQGRSREMA